ncbi:AsmA-like C-terminal region-containing protein [Allorhodopirellula solitaria]|uniref:Uncharacterized protein n=1 Tax=Allorhodopirellula solitaria TaxID=2527987 RepID=A0A5C5YI28_9BACT|nr:AsmA-like C-terminal region-containing protein [Allorhodopirellula solitaria]TWT74122.1 hypothetical protein CA85_10080 [Allorhodopirellula solitaria]
MMRPFLLIVSLLVTLPATRCCWAQQRAQEAAQEQPAANPPRYWTTQWAFEDIDAGKLVSRLARIGIDIGVPLDGKVTVQFEVGVPWTALGDGAAYRFDGTLRSPSLRVDTIRCDDLRADVRYRSGKVSLSNLRTRLTTATSDVAGVIDGEGTAELIPRGDVTAKLNVKDIALRPITDLVMKVRSGSANTLIQAGTVSGNVQFAAPLDAISDVSSYELQANLQGDSLQLQGLPPASLDIRDVSIESSTLNLGRFELSATDDEFDSLRLQGTAVLPLAGVGPFQVDVAGDDIPTQSVAAFFQSASGQAGTSDAFAWVQGKLDFRGQGKGRLAASLADSQWDIQAAVASPGLRVAGVDLGILEHEIHLNPSHLQVQPTRTDGELPAQMRVRRIACDYVVEADAVRLDSLDAELFGGSLTGSGSVPFSGQGLVVADVKFADIRPVIRLPLSTANPPDFSASFAGDLKWRVPVGLLDQPASHQGTARLDVANMRLGDEALGELSLELSADQGEVSLRGDGRVLDGTVRIDMAAATSPEDRWSDVIGRLHRSNIRLGNLPIGSMLRLAGMTHLNVQGDLSGEVSGTSLPQLGRSGADTQWELNVTNLRHENTLVSRRITSRGRFDGRVLSIDSLVGDYAGGSARSSGRIEIDRHTGELQLRTDLTARIDRVDVHRGLLFAPAISDRAEGKVSATVRVSGIDQALRVRGNAIGRDLAVSDIPLGTARSGIHLDADIVNRRWKLRLPTITAQVGGGSLDGDVTVASSQRGASGVDLSSQWKARRVDFFRLSDQLGQATSRATGEITGDLSIGGKSVRSVDDIAGRFRFRLGETRGGAVPGLAGAGRWLGPVSLATEQFHVGEARGVIGNGVLTMDEFWLGGDAAVVRADGRIFLRSKRMDMEALIATGDYRDIAFDLQQLAEQYLLRTLLPGSVILDISDLLRDRTLVVRILGRIDHPIVRLQTAKTFREEAARFLIRESSRLILTSAGVGVFDGFD